MGQHFQVDGKKSELFKHFPLVRSLDDDEASVSLGQVTKLTPDAESQVFQRYGSGQVAFQAEPYINVPVGSAVSGGCEEVGMIHRDIYKSLPGLSHPPECWQWTILSRQAGHHGETRWHGRKRLSETCC
ncbi:hypothetical protein TNCV_826691 [Trichonephila clavipes]|nr:hypothetical protein TNCV_826691 [Trichonephila clavipes]